MSETATEQEWLVDQCVCGHHITAHAKGRDACRYHPGDCAAYRWDEVGIRRVPAARLAGQHTTDEERPTVAEQVRCGNTEPHNFHEHRQEVEVHCSGQARCGAQDHESHTSVETQRQWCPGICRCGLGRGIHGPGAHK